MRAVVVGAVGSTEILLECLAEQPEWEVPLVLTLPPALHSRHSDIVDLCPLAAKAGATVHLTGDGNESDSLAAIANAQPDYIFVIGWSRICGPDFLSLCPEKIVGYHPAALPRLRGRAALPWTILLEEKITAGSLFWMAEGTDDGDILSQEYFHIAPDETASTLYEKHMAALKRMLTQTLPLLARGEEPRKKQDERYASWAARRTAQDGRIDWSCSAYEIDRLVRAVGRPYPGAFSQIGDSRIVIWQSAISTLNPAQFHALPGQIIARQKGSFTIQTGNGLLDVLEWEHDGQRQLPMHSILGEL
ncbi:MAG: methionyl-tRNA formyltransferase [Sphingomonadaceae bacterium]